MADKDKPTDTYIKFTSYPKKFYTILYYIICIFNFICTFFQKRM